MTGFLTTRLIYLLTQGPSIVNPLYSTNNINLDGMSEDERNHTLEMYGDNSYSLNIYEVVM